MKLTYFELFAGAGGLSRGLEMAGWQCLGHAEIEPHARAVLRTHWPAAPLFGDVSVLTGEQVIAAAGGQVPLMLTGGSPCQDLSVAGKRAGLAGARSGLFHQQMRLWGELGSTYCLWENVLGALSSNRGADFAAVLSTFVGSPVAVPRDGWRGGGGVVAGRTGVAAWRVLDCQYFGPPQRRRRVFVLGVRAGGCDPGEVLLEATSVSGYPAPRGEAGEGAPARAGEGAGSGVAAFQNTGQGWWNDAPVAQSIRTPAGSGSLEANLAVSVYDARGNGEGSVVSTLPTTNIGNVGDYTPVIVAPTFAAGAHPGGANGQDAVQHADAIMRASGVARPRRLTPRECERLMGWPDDVTAEGIKEDGTVYALSDTARYRLCGNGVASPVVAWIAFRLRAAEEGKPTDAYEDVA